MCDYSRKPVKWQVGNFSNLESTYHKYSVKLAKTNDNVISYLKLAFAINAIGRNSFTFITNHADSLVLRKRVEFIPPDI